jgi:hypothetical protein
MQSLSRIESDFGTVSPVGHTITVEWRNDAADPEWDTFLETAPGGEFLQTSRWGQAKQSEGWQVNRALLKQRDSILAGFQILSRPSKTGRIGYLSRGPVFASAAPELRFAIAKEVQMAARRLRLRILIVQGSQIDATLESAWHLLGFLPNRLHQIITATWLFPMANPKRTPAIANSNGTGCTPWRKSRAANLRQAIRRGVTVREGNEEDLATFFDLMVESCRRQQTSPNPATLESLRAFWKAFRAARRARVTFAMHEGCAISGLMSLAHGPKAYIWKKGSRGDALPLHPMECLYHDAFSWAQAQGFAVVDSCGISRRIAEVILQRNPLTNDIKSSRDYYNMGFGGHAELLPEASVWIPNPILRAIYRFGACSKLGTALLRQRFEC